jgi:transcription antitermination factor NusG
MPWYVMHSKPNKEELLYEQLRSRNIDTYYPRIKVQPVNPRARKRKPYFPGYLFIKADLDALGPSTLRWMPGALGLVDFGSNPASVPDELLQAIQKKVEHINKLDENQAERFRAGEVVTIQTGPFAGYHAIFDSRLPGHERVRVLLQMLSDRQVGVEHRAGQIRHQEQHHPR